MTMATVEHLMDDRSIENLHCLGRNESIVAEVAVLTLATPIRDDVRGQAEPGATATGLWGRHFGALKEFPSTHSGGT
jgi:hypothetical protein